MLVDPRIHMIQFYTDIYWDYNFFLPNSLLLTWFFLKINIIKLDTKKCI